MQFDASIKDLQRKCIFVKCYQDNLDVFVDRHLFRSRILFDVTRSKC